MVSVVSSIARVEPLTTARALRGPFDYRIPSSMSGVDVGSVLVVPFGRRRVLGLVVDLAGESEIPPERLVEPVRALESGVPDELVDLGLWIADAYCSTPARGLALVLPPGTGTSPRAAPGASTRELLEASLTLAGREALAGSRHRRARAAPARGARPPREGPVHGRGAGDPARHADEPRAPRPGADRAPRGGAQAGRASSGAGAGAPGPPATG